MKRSWSDEDLRVAVACNITMSGVLRRLGLSTSPGNYRTLAPHIKRLALDTSHFKGRAHGTSISPKARSLEELLTEGSIAKSTELRKKLLRLGLLENRCSECGLGPVWNDKELTLQLDHINGDPSDNRIENLRILCPNCHTQTHNFTGKNISSRYRRQPTTCFDCQAPIFKGSTRCRACAGRTVEAKITWPDPQVLAEDVVKTSYVAVAARLGVSDNAVKKYLRRRLGHAPRKYNR